MLEALEVAISRPPRRSARERTQRFPSAEDTDVWDEVWHARRAYLARSRAGARGNRCDAYLRPTQKLSAHAKVTRPTVLHCFINFTLHLRSRALSISHHRGRQYPVYRKQSVIGWHVEPKPGGQQRYASSSHPARLRHASTGTSRGRQLPDPAATALSGNHSDDASLRTSLRMRP